jgi:hypothetical protein
MTKSQVEVITSVERRRRWSAAEKERIVVLPFSGAIIPNLLTSATSSASWNAWECQLYQYRHPCKDAFPVRLLSIAREFSQHAARSLLNASLIGHF